MTDAGADKRVTLREAAGMLGVSESAVRKRVERGTLRSDKGADGKRYVYLDVVTDTVVDKGADASATHESDELTSELRDRLRYVEGQLEAERQAHAEARRIIAGLVERIPPAIEAPQRSSEPRESPQTVAEESERAEPRSATEGSQEGAQRPWWRRVFRG
jgi:predicted ArsR family transcriptional regulator